MKKLLIIIFLITTGLLVNGQHTDYTQYYYNYFFLNPAYTGTQTGHNIETIYRSGISGNVKSPSRKVGLGYHTASDTNNYGYGASLYYNEDYFQLPTAGFNLNFSYGIDFSENTQMNLGGALSINRHGFEYQGYYDTLGYVGGQENKFFPSLHFGAFLNSNDKFMLGVSMFNISQPQVEFSVLPTYTAHRIFVLMAAYHYEIEEDLMLVPSMVIRQGGAANQTGLDFKAHLDILQNFILGVGFGTRFQKFYPNQFRPTCENCIIGNLYAQNSALSAMLGIKFYEKYRFIVSYDYPFQQVGAMNTAFVEASLSIQLPKD